MHFRQFEGVAIRCGFAGVRGRAGTFGTCTNESQKVRSLRVATERGETRGDQLVQPIGQLLHEALPFQTCRLFQPRQVRRALLAASDADCDGSRCMGVHHLVETIQREVTAGKVTCRGMKGVIITLINFCMLTWNSQKVIINILCGRLMSGLMLC